MKKVIFALVALCMTQIAPAVTNNTTVAEVAGSVSKETEVAEVVATVAEEVNIAQETKAEPFSKDLLVYYRENSLIGIDRGEVLSGEELDAVKGGFLLASDELKRGYILTLQPWVDTQEYNVLASGPADWGDAVGLFGGITITSSRLKDNFMIATIYGALRFVFCMTTELESGSRFQAIFSPGNLIVLIVLFLFIVGPLSWAYKWGPLAEKGAGRTPKAKMVVVSCFAWSMVCIGVMLYWFVIQGQSANLPEEITGFKNKWDCQGVGIACKTGTVANAVIADCDGEPVFPEVKSPSNSDVLEMIIDGDPRFAVGDGPMLKPLMKKINREKGVNLQFIGEPCETHARYGIYINPAFYEYDREFCDAWARWILYMQEKR